MINNRKINLILYIDSLMIGGMHRQTLYLAKYLNKNIFNVSVLTQNTDKGGLREEFYNSGCKMIDLGRDSTPNKKKSFNPFLSFKLYKIFKKENTDIIYLNAAPNLIYFKIVNFFLIKKISLIGSFRALTFWKGHLSKSYKWIDIFFSQLLYNSSKFTVVNSNALNKHYSKILKIRKPLITINNGSDFSYVITKKSDKIRNDLKIDSNECFVLMSARLDPWKDFTTFVNAAKIVVNKTKLVKFVIMGDGPLKDDVKKLISKNNLEHNILMIGEKKDAINYVNACDISVLCSFGEGFSNTILESMFLKKPVIATNVGGNVDLIGKTNKFGYLVPKSSHIDIANKILFLKDKPEIRIEIGKSAKKKITELCELKSYIRKYEEIFIKTLK